MLLLNFAIFLYITTAIYCILALSFDFQYGQAGLVNFGQVAFFCIGAYASALTVLSGAPIVIGIAVAMIITGLAGAIISFTARNMGGTYWGIATLAIGEIVRLFALNEDWLTGGAVGLANIPGLPRHLFLVVVSISLVGTYLTMRFLQRAPYGRVLRIIREDDDLSSAMGKNTFSFKMRAIAVGGTFGGLAGSLYAHYMRYIGPEAFFPIETFIVWGMAILGGKGNSRGIIVGAIIIQFFYMGTRIIKDYLPLGAETLASLRMFIIGLLIMLIMMYRPEGLFPEKKRIYKNFQN